MNEKEKEQPGITKNFWEISRVCHMFIETPEGEEETGTEEIFEEIMTGMFQDLGQIMNHRSESSENVNKHQ